MCADIPNRRTLLAGAVGSAIGLEVSPFVRPAQAQPAPDAEANSSPATFDDYADMEFQGVVFESGKEALGAVRLLYDGSWPAVAMMTMLLQRDHHGVAELAAKCEDAAPEIIQETQVRFAEAQDYFRNLSELMGKAELRFMAGVHRMLKERGETC